MGTACGTLGRRAGTLRCWLALVGRTGLDLGEVEARASLAGRPRRCPERPARRRRRPSGNCRWCPGVSGKGWAFWLELWSRVAFSVALDGARPRPQTATPSGRAKRRWAGTGLRALIRACRVRPDAELYEQRVAEVQAAWRERLGKVRRGSAAERLIGVLPGAPIVTVKSAAMLTSRSFQAVNDAIPRLVEAKVITPTTLGRRNRAFEATELLDTFNALERQLASPEGDTNSSPAPHVEELQRENPRAPPASVRRSWLIRPTNVVAPSERPLPIEGLPPQPRATTTGRPVRRSAP